MERKEAQTLMRTDAPLMIGHTRMTSMGNDVTDENAHPFVEGNVIGAHNGIINNYMELDRTVNVDSQAVFRMLDAHPEAYDYVFPKVSGSAALTWWDARDAEALFLVAHQNPLSVAIVPRINTVFWSSVNDHLESILRAGYGNNVIHMDFKKDTIYRLDADDIYSWQEAEVFFGTDVKYSLGTSRGLGTSYGWAEATDEELWEMYGGSRVTDDNDDDEFVDGKYIGPKGNTSPKSTSADPDANSTIPILP